MVLSRYVFGGDVDDRLLLTAANGHPAVAIYRQAPGEPAYQPFGLIVPLFSAENQQIIELTAFLMPQLLTTYFDLPAVLPISPDLPG